MAKQRKKRGRLPKVKPTTAEASASPKVIEVDLLPPVEYPVVDPKAMEASGQGYDTDEATGDIVTIYDANIVSVPDDIRTPSDVPIAVRNDHNVQNGQWAARTDQQQCMFNDLYSDMICSPSAYNSPPNAPFIELDQWRTISRNAALKAANCV